MKDLYTFKEFCKRHPWPSLGTLKAIYTESRNNGDANDFRKVVRKIGTRLLICEEDFFKWVDEQDEKAKDNECERIAEGLLEEQHIRMNPEPLNLTDKDVDKLAEAASTVIKRSGNTRLIVDPDSPPIDDPELTVHARPKKPKKNHSTKKHREKAPGTPDQRMALLDQLRKGPLELDRIPLAQKLGRRAVLEILQHLKDSRKSPVVKYNAVTDEWSMVN